MNYEVIVCDGRGKESSKLYHFHSYSWLIVVLMHLGTAAELIFEEYNNLSRLATLYVICIVRYTLSSCLATLTILLCYQSTLTVQMVLDLIFILPNIVHRELGEGYIDLDFVGLVL